MSEAVQHLNDAANHFAFSDWDYTRNHQIKHIRFTPKGNPHDTFRNRFKTGWHFLVTSKKRGFIYDQSLLRRIQMFWFCLHRDPNQPDGILDGGNVITFWEETGEYLQLVQPSVGALLATFLKEEPEHPHAKLIIAELERIDVRYAERIAARRAERNRD